MTQSKHHCEQTCTGHGVISRSQKSDALQLDGMNGKAAYGNTLCHTSGKMVWTNNKTMRSTKNARAVIAYDAADMMFPKVGYPRLG